MGRFYNALEKYKNQNKSAQAKKIRKSGYELLLQYDRTTGKLDINNPAIIKEPENIDRLVIYGLMQADGILTPAGIAKCQELKDHLKIPASELPLKVDRYRDRIPITTGASNAEVDREKSFTITTPKIEVSNEIDKNLVSVLKPKSFEDEQFNILRTNILFPTSGKSPRSIMVTSALPSEGKSFVSANLAVSIARHINKHVLLIDCDLRRPNIHHQFGFGDVRGISEYLFGEISLPALLLKTNIDHLTILPGGKPPDNPSELLSSDRMCALLKEVTSRYDDRLIILDTPPLRLAAEATALARHADCLLLVVKYGSTSRDTVIDLIDKLGKDKIIGAIINYFQVSSPKYYRKYYDIKNGRKSTTY